MANHFKDYCDKHQCKKRREDDGDHFFWECDKCINESKGGAK